MKKEKKTNSSKQWTEWKAIKSHTNSLYCIVGFFVVLLFLSYDSDHTLNAMTDVEPKKRVTNWTRESAWGHKFYTLAPPFFVRVLYNFCFRYIGSFKLN